MTNHIDDDEESPFESPLAKEFEEEYKKFQEQVKPKIDAARALLREAVALADEQGMPLRVNPSFLSNGYVPPSFQKSKYKELDSEVLADVTGVYSNYDNIFEYGGWVHSAVC